MLSKIINKKSVFIGSWIISLGFFLLNETSIELVCNQNNICIKIITYCSSVLVLTFFPAALIATILVFLKDSIFKVWFYLFIIWAFIFIITDYLSSGTNGGYISPSSRAFYDFYGILLFILLSLALILIKSVLEYRKK